MLSAKEDTYMAEKKDRSAAMRAAWERRRLAAKQVEVEPDVASFIMNSLTRKKELIEAKKAEVLKATEEIKEMEQDLVRYSKAAKIFEESK